MARDSRVTRDARMALVGYVVVTFLAFPHPLGDRVLDLGFICAWLSPACLVFGLRGLAPRRAALMGFVAGLAAQTAILHWLYIVSVVYGHAAPLIGFLGPLVGGIHSAAFTALFAAGLAALERRALATPIAAALLWTVADHLRATALGGFPWATLGYAQHENSLLLGLVSYTGVYALTTVSVLGGAALAGAAVARREGRFPPRSVWAAIAGVLVLHAVGALLRVRDPDAGVGTVRVAVLQGNIEQGVKWRPEWIERTVATYEALARRASEAGAELIVLPESAIPGALNSDAELRFRFAELARETGAAFVIGSVAVETAPGRRPRYFDSAFVLEPDGEYTDRYDKSHLVPFGEYVPLAKLLGGVLQAVARGIAIEGVTEGPGPRPVSLAIASVESGGVTVGVPICYELLFPDLVRRFVRDGAELLLAVTNDAWYGRTGAPHQFLAMTAVRSAETGVWTARAANTGVSAMIDARGRVRESTRLFERDLLVADVPLRPSPLGGTFYTRNGDLFVYSCWIGVVGLGLVCCARSVRGATR